MMNIRLMREEDLFQVTSLHDVLFKQSFNFEDYVQEKMFHYGIVIEIDHQIVGYLLSGDLGYITSYKNARQRIQKLDRLKILEVLVKKSIDL